MINRVNFISSPITFRSSSPIHVITQEMRPREDINESNMETVFTDKMKEWELANKQKNINIFGNEVTILNGDSDIDLQSFITSKCDRRCKFCISAMSKTPVSQVGDDEYAKFVGDTISEYKKNGNLNIDASITGGEPLLYKNRVKKVLGVLAESNVRSFKLNTSGFLLRDPEYIDLFNHYLNNYPFNLDVSRHHYDDRINEALFGKPDTLTLDELSDINQKLGNKLTIRGVLIKNYIDSIDELKLYLNSMIDKGFNSFSFRNLCTYEGEPNKMAFEYARQNKIDFFQFIKSVFQDKDFKFINQLIKDRDAIELYKYKDKPVRLLYLDNEFLRKQEISELKKNRLVHRTGVILPNKTFAISWNTDIKKITLPFKGRNSKQGFLKTV